MSIGPSPLSGVCLGKNIAGATTMKLLCSSVIVGVIGIGVYLPTAAVLAATKGGACLYEHCIEHCWVSGEQALIVGRKGGSSCPDLCKRRGCADYNPVLNGSWPIIDRP